MRKQQRRVQKRFPQHSKALTWYLSPVVWVVEPEQEQLLYPEDAADRETKNAPPCLPECRKRRILRTQSCAFLCSVLRKDTPWKRCFSAGLSEGGERLGETQLFLFSDPPRRWFYFDYDPGPFSCVHLQVFIFIFIIAPPKNGVNPKPWIYRNFIL